MLQLTPEMQRLVRWQQSCADEKARQERLAARLPKRKKLNKDRFKNAVDAVARVLRAGEPTRFAFEGACRHGLRSRLILVEWRWTDADDASAEVVAAALARIGAVRPTWQQGQIDYALAHGTQRYFCARCGSKIPEERETSNGTPVKYCSMMCRDVQSSINAKRYGGQVSLAEYLAACAEKSAQTVRERSGECEQCRSPFISRLADRKFCSHRCYTQSMTKHPEKPCERCGTMFKPRYSAEKGISRYCSSACSAEARAAATPRLRRTCLTCNAAFSPTYPSNKKRYCSPFCKPSAPKRVPSLLQCGDASDSRR